MRCWGRGRKCGSARNILVKKNLCKSRNNTHTQGHEERDEDQGEKMGRNENIVLMCQ